MSAELEENYLNNVKLNPGFTHMFIDDHDCAEFVETRVKPKLPKLAKAYNMLKVGVYKADILRLSLLYFEGGFYMDVNKKLLDSLEDRVMKKD